MSAFDRAWALLKAPLIEAQFNDGYATWDTTIDEEERQENFNHLFPDYMKTPLQGETYGGLGDTYWHSKDDMARGSASIDTSEEDWSKMTPGEVWLHHFEIAQNLRGQGKSQAYLEEMIAELKQRALDKNPSATPNVHATRVDYDVAPYWNKMVDRGLISSASENKRPRYTFDGKNIAPRIWNDELIPVEQMRDFYAPDSQDV